MKFKMDYKESLKYIDDDIFKMSFSVTEGAMPTLWKIGSGVRRIARKYAPRQTASYYPSITKDGKIKYIKNDPETYYSSYGLGGHMAKNTHIQDDIIFYRGINKNNVPYVSITGDKNTWPKWILASDGHVSQAGRFIPGNHFVQKTEAEVTPLVDNIVDQFIKGVIDG